jgi:threonine dehydratase
VRGAAASIAPWLQRTPLLRSPKLDALAGGMVWLKAESLQLTGSFKARGALNALLALAPAQRARGVIAYSTGNHGQAIAWAASLLGVPAAIVMPHDAPANKIARAKAHGARVVHYDRRHQSREQIGMRLLQELGGTLIPPGDHPDVIAGQGTVALEAMNQLPPEVLPELRAFLAPCGGGGLVAGCGLVLQALSPHTRICAVEPAGFDDTVRSLASGERQANLPGAASRCDALQAATPAELPFEINRNLVDRACAVTEAEVADAVRYAAEELRLVVEPGGAVALAAVLAGRVDLEAGHGIVVLSGGNIDAGLLAQLLAGDDARRG